MSTKLKLEFVSRPVAALAPYAGNPRKNDSVIDRMCDSIREYGFTVPVLITPKNKVVDGHLRLKAAKKLGMTAIPAIVCDGWSESQIKAFRIMSNSSVAWASWDFELLRKELADLDDMKFDLSLTGLSKASYETLDSTPQLGGMEYRVVVDCNDEDHQREIIERLESDGLVCRPLIS